MGTQREGKVIALLIGASLLASSVDVAAQHPPGEPSIIDVAERLMAGCLAYAAQQKLPPISIALVDESGALVTFRRQRGASGITADAAVLKARTAMRARTSTAALAAQDPATRDSLIVLGLTTIPGGVPYLGSDGRLLGAVGVSGAQPSQDAGCAEQAVAGAGR